MIPVVDLFAGPGGLGEGFSALCVEGRNAFRVVLSIENNPFARETLKLRSFFRQFQQGAPDEYYDALRGGLTVEELYRRYAQEASQADSQAWLCTLGEPDKASQSAIDTSIQNAVGDRDDWVLIGGPPCQAYSVVGRSRMTNLREKHEKDPKHFLYKAYLRILALHKPPVFVMENVKGILSSKVAGELIITQILEDLKKPSEAVAIPSRKTVTYHIYPFADYRDMPPLFKDIEYAPSDYIIRCEEHGVPQARHRLILLGVRSDIEAEPRRLKLSKRTISMWKVIRDLPKLRSKLSRSPDSAAAWAHAVRNATSAALIARDGIPLDVLRVMKRIINAVDSELETGGSFVRTTKRLLWQRSWFLDARLNGVCNHESRAHMESDLWRYFYAACFAQANGRSPVLGDFPLSLLPRHKNAKGEDEDDEIAFDDRFRVQLKKRPATTVTAHIAKDGHYFIHPDPLQCRSLTVREAARLQTFPDNYLFLGPRTSQYQQVGNAVPPIVARQLAKIVFDVLSP
jgi:DNA (cytosine-5)-methyltransferase 1